MSQPEPAPSLGIPAQPSPGHLLKLNEVQSVSSGILSSFSPKCSSAVTGMTSPKAPSLTLPSDHPLLLGVTRAPSAPFCSAGLTKTKAGRHGAAGVSALLVFIVDEWSQPVLTTPKAGALSSLTEGSRSLPAPRTPKRLHPPGNRPFSLRRSIHGFFS